MPKLILFAAAEKVLVDRASNSATLVNLLQDIHFKLPPGGVLPQNFALPVQWAVFSLWQEEPADAGISFEQRIVVESSTGQIVIENVERFQFQQKNQRMITNIAGLPYSRRLTITLFLRVTGIPDWRPMGSYPLEMIQDMV